MEKDIKPALQDLFIGIAGLIGAGKSTLATALGEHMGLPVYYEPVQDNEYLADFYTDTAKYAFSMQIYLLNRRFQQHQEIIWQGGGAIQDRTIYEDAEVFAAYLHRRRSITTRDWKVYQALYSSILESLRPPDLLIYLRADVRTLRRRIKQRGRPEEQDIPATYIRRLNELYEEWFSSYDRSRTLVIETGRMNYLEDLEHLIDLKTEIEKFL